jgi:hypothetical protein
MKLSNFETQRRSSDGVDQGLMDRHAKRVGRQMNFNHTIIERRASDGDPLVGHEDELTRIGQQRLRSIRRSAGRDGLDSARSYICDEATRVVARYLHPDQNVRDAVQHLSESLMARQKDRSVLSRWVGLRFYLASTMPATATIRDCNPLTIAVPLRLLAANVN